MEKRENDLMLNIVANPQFKLEDFATIGFDINNTSLLDKSVYKNNPLVLKTFSDEDGKFNDKLFNDVYNKALVDYNTMSLEGFYKNLEQLAIYHRDNFDAPVSQRRTGPDFKQVIIPNPDRVTSSLTRLGEIGERTKSTDELAQANRVLLNPTEVYKNGDADWSKALWGNSANDGFFDYFFDTLVMAQWDEDGTHIDPITGLETLHKKGELKIGADGTYFYEKLDGRDIYGRRVLNKMNVLTEDGSALNKYDFFDSDDINLKSIGGSILKNAALVGSMFIPYVGPVVAGLSVATLLAGLTATLGKMLVGSDSPTLSAIEGWSKSVSRQGATSEYALDNTWCWENFINLIGDVAGLLKELRFIFEKIPAAITGKYVGSTKAYNKELESLTNNYLKIAESSVDDLHKAGKTAEAVRAALELAKVAPLRAQASMDSFMKGYNKIGEILSKGYMTAITVGDTYGEAKAAGASDLDATLLTLGYAAGEYAILNTGIGEWILPELRANKFKNKAIIDALTKLDDETLKLLRNLRLNLNKTSKETKKEYVKRVFNLGKDIAKATYVDGSRKGKQLLTASLAAGAGEGVEEVSEELLADFSKGCYNVVNWLRGEDTRLSSFGFQWDDDKNMTWDGKEMFDRYSMSLIGGAIGGSLTNLGTTYRMTQDLAKIDRRKAIQEIVYMARNGGLDDLRKQVKQMEFGDKNLSATEFVEIDGKLVPKPGTIDNNLDLIVKKALNDQISFIENMLNAEGTNIPDDSFLDKLSLSDLRFNALHNSVTAGRFMQEFNSLNTKLIQLVAASNQITNSAVDTNKDGVNTDQEKRNAELSDEQKNNLKKIEQQIKDTRKALKDLIEGKRADEFIGDALFEMITALSGRTVPITFPLWLKYTKGKDYSDFTDVEKEELKLQYRTWKETEAKDDIHLAATIYRDMAVASSNVIKNYELLYLNKNKDIQDIDSLVSGLYNIIADSDENWLYEADKRNKLIALTTQFANKLGIDGYLLLFESLEVKERSILDSTTLSDDEKTNELKIALDKYKSQLLDLIYNHIENYISLFMQLGFANTETKNLLKRIINFPKSNLLTQISDIQVRLDEEAEAFLPNEEMLDSLQNDFDLVLSSLSKLEALELLVDTLNNTPFEESLNLFAISIGKDPINITQLIQKVNQLFAESGNDITSFNLSGETARELNAAIETMELYQLAILGARTDALSLDDIFGYNVTLNEVSGKLGKQLNLAEIDSNYADILCEDINVNKNKLKFLRDLYKVNRGQRLSKQLRVGTLGSVLFFNKLKTFVSVPDNDPIRQSPEFLLLELIISSLTLHNRLSNNSNSLSLSLEEKISLQSEEIKLRDGLYDFFNSIDDNTLTRLLDPDRLNLYDYAENLLNENLNEIDGNAFVWWMTSSAAVKASDFYAKYNQSLNPKSRILPIPTLEIAIYNNYAAVVNGDVFTRFLKAYRAAIKLDWKSKSIEARKQILSKLGKLDFLAEESWADYCFNFLPKPRYLNIILTEGIPGSGKTSGVFLGVVNLLRVTHPDLLKNVRIVHCADIKGSETKSLAVALQKALDVKGKASDALTFMEEIAPDYTQYPVNNDIYLVNDSDYEITKNDKEIKSKLGISKNSDNAPSLIIIDEVTKLTAYDLDLIDKYAKTHGITVLVAGDYDLNGVVGQHKVSINKQQIDWLIDTNRTEFIRCPKLGVSMRTDNVIMSDDLAFFLEWMKNPIQSLNLNFYEDETGLYGIKNVYNTDISSVIAEVKQLIPTLKKDKLGKIIEKIGFIGIPGSLLTTELSKDEHKDYIEIKEGDSAQGSEGLYYIIEGAFDLDYKDKKWLRRVYTGLSRASLGALLAISSEVPIRTNQVSEKIDESGTESGNLKYMALRKLILDLVAISTLDIPYKARTKEKVTNSSNTASSNTTLSGATLSDISNTDSSNTDLTTDQEIPKGLPPAIDTDDEVAPTATTLREYTKELLLEKWGDKMGISKIDVEINGHHLELKLMNIHHSWETGYGNFNIVDYNDRKIVLVKVGNFVQPFYCSTGLAGKSTPHTWLPFFGINSKPADYDGPSSAWLNKTSEDDIRNYYYNPIFEAIGHKLDEVFGTELRDVDLGINVLYDYNDADWILQINRSFPNPPDDYDTRGTNVFKNVEYAKKTITEEWNKLINGESPLEPITPSFKVGDYLTEIIGDKKTLFLVLNISDDGIVTLLNIETNQILEEDLSIIEALLEQSYIITNKEDLISPLDDNETPLIDTPKSEDEYLKKLDDENEGDLDVLPLNTVKEENGLFSLLMLLHSFNTYETGVVYDPETGQIHSDSERIKARIDSVNGLLKAELILGKRLKNAPKGTIEEYKNLIGRIRKVLYNVKENDKICEKVSKLLGILNLLCTFALKCSPTHSDTEREYVSSNPDAYGTSKNEHLEHHNSVAKNSQLVLAHKIVAIFKTELNGEFLEIPILSLTSPFTFIQLKIDGEDVFPDLNGIYLERNALKVDKHIIILELLKICNANPRYKHIGNLLRLYDFTFNGLFRIPDLNWTPAKNLIPQGINFVQKAGFYYDEDSGRIYDADDLILNEWMSIEKFAEDRQFNITTKVLVSRSEGIVKKGHPFILVTSDPDLISDKLIIDRYMSELSDPFLEKKVKLIYIMPPSASAREYIQHLEKILYTKKSDIDLTIKENIGNMFTPYRILSILCKNENARNLINQLLPGLLAQLDPIISELDSYGDNIQAIKTKLSDPVLLQSTTPIKLITYLGKILTHIAYNKGKLIDIMNLNPKDLSLDESAIKIIEDTLNSANYTIYHKAKIRGESLRLGSFIVVDLTDGYLIDGKPCKIHGKVDLMSYMADLSDLINFWVSEKMYDKEDKYHNPLFTSNGKRVLGSYDEYIPFVAKSELKSQEPSITTAGEKLLRVFNKLNGIIQLDSIPNLYTITELELLTYFNDISNKINLTIPNRISFVVNGELFVSEPSKFFNGSKIINGLVIPKQKFEITLVENGLKVNYTAEYNEDKLTIVDNVLPVPLNNIDYQSIHDLKRVFDSELREFMEEFALSLYINLFNADSLGKFIQSASNLDYIESEIFLMLINEFLDNHPEASDEVKILLLKLSEINEDNNPFKQKKDENPICGFNHIITMI